MSNQFGLTDAQVTRQLDRIQEILFKEVEEENDETYRGVVKPEVLDIFIAQFPLDESGPDSEGMTPESFKERLGQVGLNLTSYILEKQESINKTLLMYFLSDFISQIMNNIFKVFEEDTPDNSDFMYG
ncbi:MAG: hypothetical protein CMA72_04670 [Euryarchaeota archaeon]|jgi:hypothetical protein|nr:hypothetical protein [Euryarchaeota archaeon]|tara:strand:- start:682 stop:1065 length:384 start_codon:yes stop_codon:yes gene_type:complete